MALDDRCQLALAAPAAARERERIAGELYDVLAHRIAAAVAQAQAAVRVLAAGSPPHEQREALVGGAARAAVALAEVEHGGRETLRELRRLVRFLQQGAGGSHDVVVTAVTLMVVQAGAARTALPRDRVVARQAAEEVVATARAGLAHVRRLLPLLGDGSRASYVPQPGLDQLDGLVERVAAAGVSVRLDRHGRPRPLPPGTDISAYRIVQEALRSCPTGPVTVTLDYEAAALVLEVCAGGRPPAGDAHALTAMRARAALAGGSLTADARPDGGFLVRARLPLEESP